MKEKAANWLALSPPLSKHFGSIGRMYLFVRKAPLPVGSQYRRYIFKNCDSDPRRLSVGSIMPYLRRFFSSLRRGSTREIAKRGLLMSKYLLPLSFKLMEYANRWGPLK